MNGRDHQKGFSLIEVIVALAILALVSTSVLSLLSQNSRFIIGAEDRLLAGVLADNLMVDRLATSRPLDEGSESYACELASRTWNCQETITIVGETGLLRIDIAVHDALSDQLIVAISSLKPLS